MIIDLKFHIDENGHKTLYALHEYHEIINDTLAKTKQWRLVETTFEKPWLCKE
jgi:hypothetical protein